MDRLQLRAERQVSPVADEVAAVTAAVRPILQGTLFTLKRDVADAVGGYDRITLEMLARVYRQGDGDCGICFEYAVHDAMVRGNPAVVERVLDAVTNYCKVPGDDPASILFAVEKSGSEQIVNTQADLLSDHSLLMSGTRGRPVKLRRHLSRRVSQLEWGVEMIAGDRPSRLSEAQLRWLAGVSAAQFAGLVVELGPMWEADRAERLTARKRSRALGGGRRYDMPFATRLFVCLVYLRWNVGYRGLGAMAGFSKDTVNRAVDKCTRLLAAKGITRPDGSRVGNEDELAEALEAVDHRALADGTFVPIPRPGDGWAAQKAEYSGHRHRHCRSTQVVTDVDGWLLWVTDDQPGPTHDLAALVGSGIPERIAAGGGTLVADRGYQGIGNHVESLDVLLPNGAREACLTLPRRSCWK